MQTLVRLSILLALGVACSDQKPQRQQESLQIENPFKLQNSHSAGNLVASAVQHYYDVDIALIPSVILDDGIDIELTQEMDPETKTKLLGVFDESKDALRTGTMKGSDIKEFILKRMTRYFDVDLQVAGIQYDLNLKGGWPESFVVTREKGQALEDDRFYRVAISNYFYRSPFPGYYYGDNMNFSFNLEFNGSGSIKRALSSFLETRPAVAPLRQPRGYVQNRVVGDAGFLEIHDIQGTAHLSPYRGYRVSTRGVITAIGRPKDRDAKDAARIGRQLPTEVILESANPDADERTSEALSLFLPGTFEELKIGQELEVSGVVHEVRTGGGLSLTSLRMIDSLSIVAESRELPPAVLLGSRGRTLSSKIPSSFVGDVNARRELRVEEGIDFWESLEGMRVSMQRPRVTGIRGGLKDFNAAKQGRASFVEVTLLAEGFDNSEERTDTLGNFYDPHPQDFNVEAIKMIDSVFANVIDPTKFVIETGDQFSEDLEGILGFNQNTFGDGRYVFYPLSPVNTPRAESTALDSRPKSSLSSDQDHVTFASWNVENLGGTDTDRLRETASVISEHLRCPDVITLPEIQDNNAELIVGGSAADQTLRQIISFLKCPGAEYRYLNIDPIPFRDGGEFGGNIRVAMLYNSSRISFTPRGNPTATSDTFVDAEGHLTQNPGRIDPRNPILEGSRKSLVAEFSFKGESFFVIGNHFNSMLGEGSATGAVQPYHYKTETKRSGIAKVVRTFIEELRSRRPDARVIVAGDFNTYYASNSLKVLAGDFLRNMMTTEGLYPRNKWYSTNYDGNSAAIDFIFASKPLMTQSPEFEILHLNSPFMVRVSDHDPLIARFAW